MTMLLKGELLFFIYKTFEKMAGEYVNTILCYFRISYIANCYLVSQKFNIFPYGFC